MDKDWAELRQLTLAHQFPEVDTCCKFCDGRWAKITEVVERLVQRGDEVLPAPVAGPGLTALAEAIKKAESDPDRPRTKLKPRRR